MRQADVTGHVFSIHIGAGVRYDVPVKRHRYSRSNQAKLRPLL